MKGVFIKTGQDTVRPYALLRILHGDVLGQLVDGALGGVVRDTWIAGIAYAGNGGDIDDCAASLPLHMRDAELAGQKHPFHIDSPSAGPSFLR